MIKTGSLMKIAKEVILDKATEAPFIGEYDDFEGLGTYLCRNCGLALYRSEHKFHSGCGWPSYDLEVKGNVKQQLDSDNRRIEIVCNRCDAHLGHIFKGEGCTLLNTRHCVNSIALDFVKDIEVIDTGEAILAAGCFWGVEYYLQRLAGILKTEVGYIGGHTENPTYQDICNKNTGHVEAIRVIYDLNRISYEDIIKYFFEIHDPTQINGQGPDIGSQYLSKIFYYTAEQLTIAKHVIALLVSKNIVVATKLEPVTTFWIAELYHQDYYNKNNHQPYCHTWQKKF